jgi:hypothetical protein
MQPVVMALFALLLFVAACTGNYGGAPSATGPYVGGSAGSSSGGSSGSSSGSSSGGYGR